MLPGVLMDELVQYAKGKKISENEVIENSCKKVFGKGN